MFELYLKCPTTGEPIYAGIHSKVNAQVVSGVFVRNAACPVCGRAHNWKKAAGWSAIPVALPAFESPPVYASADEDELPKVA